MSELSEVRKDISKVKKKLITYAKHYGIHENFGQKEIHKLNDMYFGYGYQHQEINAELESFREWCYTFDLSQLS